MNTDTVQKLRDDKVYKFGARQAAPASSLYLRVADELIKEAAGNPDDGPMLLPQERDLATRFKVSRSTIRQALALLEQYDLVQRRRGHGTLLTKPPVEVMQVWRCETNICWSFSSALPPYVTMTTTAGLSPAWSASPAPTTRAFR